MDTTIKAIRNVQISGKDKLIVMDDKMKYIFAFIFCAILGVPQYVTAQHSLKSYYLAPYKGGDLSRTTLGGSLGFTVFKNDLHGLLEAKAQNSFMNFHLSLDASFRLTNYVSIRVGGSGYQLYGEPTENAASAVIRDTKPAVYSQNLEGYVAIVHDIFSRYRIDRGKVLWNVYGMVGVGLTFFEPKNPITGDNLRPEESGPEASYQDFAYANLTPIIPVGIGFSYYLADNSALSLEITHRFTRTSWLDNAYHSYRVVDDIGNLITDTKERKVYDGYTFIGVRYQYTLLTGNGRSYSHRKYKRQKRR